MHLSMDGGNIAAELQLEPGQVLNPKIWGCPEYSLAFPEPNPEQIRKHS